MKLKYINDKQKGGADGHTSMVGLHPAMKLMIDIYAQDIRNVPINNTMEMTKFIKMRSINPAAKNYVMIHNRDAYCLILLKLAIEEITNNNVQAIPPEFNDGHGHIDFNAIIPYIIGQNCITSTYILDVILLSLHNAHIIVRPQTEINIAIQISNLIQNHSAEIEPALITSDVNIGDNFRVRRRGFIYAQLQYIHNINICGYFNNEYLVNMPRTPILNNVGEIIDNMVNMPTVAHYAGYENPNQAYADAKIQYSMQFHRLQLNIVHSYAATDGDGAGVGAPIPGPDPGYSLKILSILSTNKTDYLLRSYYLKILSVLSTSKTLMDLKKIIRNLGNNDNYVNYYKLT